VRAVSAAAVSSGKSRKMFRERLSARRSLRLESEWGRSTRRLPCQKFLNVRAPVHLVYKIDVHFFLKEILRGG
jgi:hypothetical protein